MRIAIGSLIIKQILNCSDAWTVRHISENPYLQYFIGLKEYTAQCPFGESTMVVFRKRLSPEDIAQINEWIIPKTQETDKKEEDDDSDDHGDGGNGGTLILDATCTPADIAYPQDLNLLNASREKLEAVMDNLHAQVGGKKTRNYRKMARKAFLRVSKMRKRSDKVLRRAIGKQLGYVSRDIGIITQMIRVGARPTDRQRDLLSTIATVYEQQKAMRDSHTNSIPGRIVSLSQPWVRPIVRGKAKARTEFGAKLHISLTDGYAQVERLDFEAFNEAEDFIPAIERYRERNGHYPERVLVDKLYRNRNNLAYCKEHHIAVSGPRLGRPPKDWKPDRNQEYIDICERNAVEGVFGTGKRSYGWNRIAARLKQTAQTVIHLTILALNLTKRLRAFLRLLLQVVFKPFLSLMDLQVVCTMNF